MPSGRSGRLPVLAPVREGLEVSFDRYLRLARTTTGAPQARLSLRPGVLAELAAAGLTPAATSGEDLTPLVACRVVAGSGQPLTAQDVHLVPGLERDEAATAQGVRAYAGHPVHDPTGRVLGVLAVVDTTTRTWPGDAQQALADLAGACGAELALRAHRVLADERTAAAEIGTARALSAQLDAETARYLAEQQQDTDARAAVAAQHAAAVAALSTRTLLDARHTVARVLQEAMLTRLPQPDHVHMLARYLPAAAEEQVGGDWYDAVITPDGATTLAIGDVTGHDIHAAATMGQLRSALRTLVWAEPHHTPAQVLTRLDTSIPTLTPDASATCLLARIEQPDAHTATGLRRLRWSSAGHLPPLLLHPDGTAELLHTHPELLLGFNPTTGRHDHTHDLEPGTTLVLYTDGLVERRRSHLEDDLTRLREVAARHAHLDLPDLADALVADLPGAHPEDDTALLIARLHPEDAPRPPEAGPSHP